MSAHEKTQRRKPIYRTGDPHLNAYYRLAETEGIPIERPSLYSLPEPGDDFGPFAHFRTADTRAEHDKASQDRIALDLDARFPDDGFAL